MARQVDSQYVWIDGRFVTADEAKVSFFAHAVHYGTAVFEGIRCYDGENGPAVFRLPKHLARLRSSALAYELDYRWTDEELTEAICDLIRRHEFRECYIRPVVMLGEGRLAVHPENNEVDTYIAVWSWGRYLGEHALTKGVRTAIVQDTRKYPATALDPTVKAVCHYLNSVRATREAHRRGYDEGIMLNMDGRIAEGPGENIFLLKDGTLITNPTDECILEGVTRETVIEIAEAAGIPTEIRPMSVEELLGADEAFFSGTAAEVTPIAEVDDRKIGDGGRGPLTTRIQEDYLSAVKGTLAGSRKWLTPVFP